MALPAVPLMTRLACLGVSVETTSGTENAPVASISTSPIYNARMVAGDLVGDGRRAPQGNYYGQADAVTGARMGTLTFSMDLAYGGSLLTLLKGCGYITSSTTAAPSSALSDHKTLTFRLWENGRAKRLVGAVGNFTISGTRGGVLTANFEFNGIWYKPVDQAMPSTTVGNHTLWTMKGVSAFTIGGVTIPKCNAFSLTSGNTLSMRSDITSAYGLAHGYVADRSPTFEADFEAHLVADYDAWGKYDDATTEALSLVTTAGGHSITLAAPRMQRVAVDDGERDGARLDTQTFSLNSSAGNDEFTITIA